MPHIRRRLIPLTVLALAALACNVGGGTPLAASEMTLEEALDVTPLDSRPETLRLMGPPDAFTLHWEELEGTLVRWEEWSYLDAATRFDFIDGELAWTADLDPVIDGTIFAHAYNPMDFEPTMTIDDVRAMFPEQPFEEVSLAEADIPTGVALAGDQILIGFDNERLVYVQTFALYPGDQAATSDTPATPQSLVTATPSGATPSASLQGPSAAPSALLFDDFESASPASPLFDPEFMTFTLEGGEGKLTSLYPGGVVPVMYASPVVADFALDVSLRFPGAQPDSIAGVIFRSDDAADGLAHYYHLAFHPASSTATLDVWKDGAFATVTTSTLGAGAVDRDGVNSLRLEVDGDSFRLFVNGLFVFEVEDTRLTEAGIFGLSVVAAQSGETAYFDDLRVEALPE